MWTALRFILRSPPAHNGDTAARDTALDGARVWGAISPTRPGVCRDRLESIAIRVFRYKTYKRSYIVFIPNGYVTVAGEMDLSRTATAADI
jgi:hypothetical protein